MSIFLIIFLDFLERLGTGSAAHLEMLALNLLPRGHLKSIGVKTAVIEMGGRPTFPFNADSEIQLPLTILPGPSKGTVLSTISSCVMYVRNVFGAFAFARDFLFFTIGAVYQT